MGMMLQWTIHEGFFRCLVFFPASIFLYSMYVLCIGHGCIGILCFGSFNGKTVNYGI